MNLIKIPRQLENTSYFTFLKKDTLKKTISENCNLRDTVIPHPYCKPSHLKIKDLNI